MELKHGCKYIRRVKEGVLIVPYGIETWKISKVLTLPGVLIVPYGFETTWTSRIAYVMSSFNRTLWN